MATDFRKVRFEEGLCICGDLLFTDGSKYKTATASGEGVTFHWRWACLTCGTIFYEKPEVFFYRETVVDGERTLVITDNNNRAVSREIKGKS